MVELEPKIQFFSTISMESAKNWVWCKSSNSILISLSIFCHILWFFKILPGYLFCRRGPPAGAALLNLCLLMLLKFGTESCLSWKWLELCCCWLWWWCLGCTASFCSGKFATPITCGRDFEVQLGLRLWPFGASLIVRIHWLIRSCLSISWRRFVILRCCGLPPRWLLRGPRGSPRVLLHRINIIKTRRVQLLVILLVESWTIFLQCTLFYQGKTGWCLRCVCVFHYFMLAARPQDKTGLWTDAHFDAWWKRISTKSVFQHTPHSPQKFHSISALDFVRSVLNYVHQASIISDNTKCPIDQANSECRLYNPNILRSFVNS